MSFLRCNLARHYSNWYNLIVLIWIIKFCNTKLQKIGDRGMSNRIIALDETGNFEDRKKGIRFIGGFSYDAQVVEEERKEAVKCLKNYCDDFNNAELQRKKYKVIYPLGLHSSEEEIFRTEEGNNVEENIDPNLIKRFKKGLQEQVIEFIKKKGGYIYAFADPYVTANDIDRSMGSSNLTDMKTGATLYERMAMLAIYNQLFYSMDEDCPEYYFELATRTLPKKEENKWTSLYDSSFKKKEDSELYYNYYVTNTSTYRTAIACLLYENNISKQYLNAKYNFNVKSTNYDKETAEDKSAFTYMADIVCTYIRENMQKVFEFNKGTTENKVNPEKLIDFCNGDSINSSVPIQIRIYDESDSLFRQMVKAVKNGELDRYYAIKYDMTSSDGLYKGFYLKYWIPQLEEYMLNRLLSRKDYVKKVQSLMPEYLSYTTGFMGPREIAYEKGLFVAEGLVTIITRAEFNDYRDRNKTLFYFYDVILRGHNHRGAISVSKKYIQKCEEYKGYVGIEEYIEHTLRTMQFYFNSLQFGEAVEAGILLGDIIKQLKQAYKIFYENSNLISQMIVEDDNTSSDIKLPLAGKVFSSIGQAYGFNNEFHSSWRYFRKALNEFDINSADYRITLSHALHLLIAGGRKKDYEEQAVIYFGTIGLWEQMEAVFKEKNAFALFVYMKAFNIFYAKDKGNLDILKELLERIGSSEWLKNNDIKDREHPWELIYKNLYEAVLKQKKSIDPDDYGYLKERVSTCITHPDATIKMIQIFAKIQFIMLEDPDPNGYFMEDCLSDEEVAVCRQFVDAADETTLKDLWITLKSKVTYAYI